jgi:heme exporter protein D
MIRICSELLTMILGQESSALDVFTNQESIEGDFRAWVWMAYGLVLLLLTGFSLFLVMQTRNTQRKLDHLKERFEHSQSRAHVEEK